MRSSLIPILLALAGEITLSLRREIVLSRNTVRMASLSVNSVYPRIRPLIEKATSQAQYPKYVKLEQVKALVARLIQWETSLTKNYHNFVVLCPI